MTLWKDRLRASGVHLGASVVVAALAAWLVFGLWYPYPYREISGGRDLFLLVVAVDVVIGPLITLMVFDRRKPWGELRRDLAVVAMLQVAALGYGTWTVAAARPVHLVFELDRFRVVHGVDVPQELLGREPPAVRALPWTGPTLIAVRPFRDATENLEVTMAALGGVHIGARPDFWQAYDAASRGCCRPRGRSANSGSASVPTPRPSMPRWNRRSARPIRWLTCRWSAASRSGPRSSIRFPPRSLAYLPLDPF